MATVNGAVALKPFAEENADMAGNIVIDRNECIGCEACVELCPEVFDFDGDEEKAFVKKGEEGSDADCVDEAIASCPAECISRE